MDPGTWVAAGLSLASSGVAAVGQSNAAKFRASQAKQQAEVGRIQATQVDTGYRQELADTLSNVRAMRASSGVGADSPTELAIIGNEERKSERQRFVDTGNRRIQANQSAADAKFYSASANQALLGGALEGLSAFAKDTAPARKAL